MYNPRGPRHSPYRGGYGPPQGPPWRSQNWDGNYPARSPVPSPRSRGYPMRSPGPSRGANGPPMRNQTPPPGYPMRSPQPSPGVNGPPMNNQTPPRGYPMRSPQPTPGGGGPPMRNQTPPHGYPMRSPQPSPGGTGPPMRNDTPSTNPGSYSAPYDGQGSFHSPYRPSRPMQPRHSTPFAGDYSQKDESFSSMPDYTNPQSPTQSSIDSSAYFTPPETTPASNTSYNSCQSDVGMRGGRQGFNRGRGGQYRRQSGSQNQNHGGKRRKLDFEKTLPGTLLKNSMLDSPWTGIIPTRCPFDGLVMSGGQRHSVLTPGKTAAVAALAEENSDAFEGTDEKINLTD